MQTKASGCLISEPRQLSRSITISDVAGEAGISTSTVSRILRGNDGHSYSPATQHRVRETARRLGYRPHTGARLLGQHTRTLVGISMYLTEHPHLNELLMQVHDEIGRRGYDPVLISSGQVSGMASRRLFPSPQVLAGLISVGRDLEYDWPEHYDALRRRMPIVALHPVCAAAAPWVDEVRQDYQAGFAMAIEHLLDLGHRDIAHVTSLKSSCPGDIAKVEAWRQAADRLGIAIQNVEFSVADVHQESDRLDDIMSPGRILEVVAASVAQWEAMRPRPTSLIFDSDEVALCMQSLLQRKGWAIPGDVSIVGYNGLTMGAYTNPALTTLATDVAGMARAAIDCLLQRISDRSDDPEPAPAQISIAPVLVIRGSTAEQLKPEPDAQSHLASGF